MHAALRQLGLAPCCVPPRSASSQIFRRLESITVNGELLYPFLTLIIFTSTMSSSPESRVSSFPKEVEEFDADPRVSFSKLDSKYILETDDGQEYEFDERLKRWVPVVRSPPIQLRIPSRAEKQIISCAA